MIKHNAILIIKHNTILIKTHNTILIIKLIYCTESSTDIKFLISLRKHCANYYKHLVYLTNKITYYQHLITDLIISSTTNTL